MESRVSPLLRPYLSLFIVLLDEGDAEIGMLENMVAEVNSTQVPPEDVLSGNVYYYDRIRKHLCMAMTKEEIYPQAC